MRSSVGEKNGKIVGLATLYFLAFDGFYFSIYFLAQETPKAFALTWQGLFYFHFALILLFLIASASFALDFTEK